MTRDSYGVLIIQSPSTPPAGTDTDCSGSPGTVYARQLPTDPQLHPPAPVAETYKTHTGSKWEAIKGEIWVLVSRCRRCIFMAIQSRELDILIVGREGKHSSVVTCLTAGRAIKPQAWTCFTNKSSYSSSLSTI